MSPRQDKCLLQQQEVVFAECLSATVVTDWFPDVTKSTSCCPYVPLDRQRLLMSLYMYQPVRLPVLCFSDEPQNSARIEALTHAYEPHFSVFATCGRSGPVCYSLCPLLWRVCNAPEVEHWPQFLFSRAPGQVFFSLLGENNCQHLTESLKQQPVHVNQAVCGHSHIKCRLACSAVDWLPVSVLITLVHVINTNGQGSKLQ